jgi:hypothetical protein
MSDTLRVEVVANRSVQEDFFELLEGADTGREYILIPEMQGQGASGPRRGDHIWPEENFVYIAYVPPEEARRIATVIEELRRRFPREGMRVFATPSVPL